MSWQVCVVTEYVRDISSMCLLLCNQGTKRECLLNKEHPILSFQYFVSVSQAESEKFRATGTLWEVPLTAQRDTKGCVFSKKKIQALKSREEKMANAPQRRLIQGVQAALLAAPRDCECICKKRCRTNFVIRERNGMSSFDFSFSTL